jgi:hypothetical protein
LGLELKAIKKSLNQLFIALQLVVLKTLNEMKNDLKSDEHYGGCACGCVVHDVLRLAIHHA